MLPLYRLGRRLHDLRISVTDRCNFRCVYCMPREVFGPDFAFLPRNQLLTFEVITRITRASVLDVVNEDYVRTANAKGLATSTVRRRHIIRNALLPVSTTIGLQTGLLLSGAVLTDYTGTVAYDIPFSSLMNQFVEYPGQTITFTPVALPTSSCLAAASALLTVVRLCVNPASAISR